MHKQIAVSASMDSRQLLLFAFARQYMSATRVNTVLRRFLHNHGNIATKENSLVLIQRQTAVTAYLKSKQLLLFAFDQTSNEKQYSHLTQKADIIYHFFIYIIVSSTLLFMLPSCQLTCLFQYMICYFTCCLFLFVSTMCYLKSSLSIYVFIHRKQIAVTGT